MGEGADPHSREVPGQHRGGRQESKRKESSHASSYGGSCRKVPFEKVRFWGCQWTFSFVRRAFPNYNRMSNCCGRGGAVLRVRALLNG
ncbi:hypothetical protein F183_A51370 [Bryobacterales bacterium F-183]|nr:hypothetical protein F183_A51370 [Bryobacterales bacterium F-183]